MLGVGWMFSYVTDSIGAIVVEKVVALQTCVYLIVAEPFAAGAVDVLAFCHLVVLQVVLVAEVLVLHCL